MKPLYCFKFNDITGEVTKVVIPEYKEIAINNYGKIGYKFISNEINKGSVHYLIENGKLDRFVSNKIFTFHDDSRKACEIMAKTLKEKSDEYRRYSDRCTSLLSILERWQMNECS